jgi:hypothetical protein
MTQTDAVDVTVHLYVWDLYRFQLRHMLARAWFLLIIPLAMLVLVIALLVSPSGWTRVGEVRQALLDALPLLGVFAFVFLFLPYFSAVSTSKNQNFQGEIKYSISSDGVTCRGRHSQSEIKWPAFVRVRELGWAFLLYPQKSIAYVIPKRGLGSDTDLLRIREILRRNVAKAKLLA